MLDTKLIVIDGLPGSGKTTTAVWLTQQLEQRGIDVLYIPEYDIAHPLWWYEFWDGQDYRTPDFNHIPIETFIQNSLTKWRNFTNAMRQVDRLIVAESVFFQNAIAMFLMGDALPTRLMDYARDVQQIAYDLKPVMIYFRQNNVRAALHRIIAIRGLGFEQEILQNMEGFPYLKNRNLKGLDGLTVLWQNVHTLTDTLFEKYVIQKLALETSKADWLFYRQQICDFLDLTT